MTRLATATVLGGFYETNGVPSLESVGGLGANRRMIAQLLGTKQLMAQRELMTTLDGAAAGSAASKTYGRVVAAEELGGKRTIESQALVNRNTAAADTTEIEATINSYSTKTTFGSSPVDNKDGNPLGTR